jgi:N-acyl amino acid synthase of PEP-CTERM/exosortase system
MYLPEFLNLGVGFEKYFTAHAATDDEQRRAAYRIRHEVYCEELGYEPARPDQLEQDAFDARSHHCLLRSIANDEYVGCVRLVIADPREPSAGLPFEALCGAALDRQLVDPRALPRETIAEVSRLAVVSRYRRRSGERQTPVAISERDFGTPDRPRFPYLAVGLYLAMIAQARRHGIETLFMLTEQRLARQLTRLGVHLQRIGPAIEHRGLRYPSVMSVRDVIDGLNFFLRPMFAVIADEIEASYRNAQTAAAQASVTRASSDSPS